ncbi:hypothetical protein PV646_28600 [Streptomyces sp. ID05-26A]|nr:hypothetical protein [Streptomyces sp. ID05-26A]
MLLEVAGRAVVVLAVFRLVANDKWNTVQQLPDDLDPAKAAVYVAVEGVPLAKLGGRHHVWPDGQVWWELPDGGGWKRSVLTPGDVEGDPNWQRAATA